MNQAIKKLLDVVDWANKEAEKEQNPQEKKKLLTIASMQGRILHAIGYRKPRKKVEQQRPPKNAFKKKGESQPQEIDNSSAPKNAFKYKEPNKESNEAFKIKNKDIPEGAFKEKELGEKIKGRKYAGRLSKERKQQIKQLYQEGKPIEKISNELWITEEKIKKELKLDNNSTIIADNTSKSIKSEFE